MLNVELLVELCSPHFHHRLTPVIAVEAGLRLQSTRQRHVTNISTQPYAWGSVSLEWS